MNAKRFDKPKPNLESFGIERSVGGAIILAMAVFMWGVPFLGAQTRQSPSSDRLTFQDDTWHVNVSPYLWLAGMNGAVGFAGRQVQVNQSFTDIFE